MAVTLPIDNENRMVNAILEMIRTQDLKVKQKIQLILKQEIEEEERAVSAKNGIDTRPYTLEELYGILKDDGQPYNAKRNEYLNDKYGL
ncbi:hypothetical protein [Bacteroides caecigallinarum]|uniref:hypothetical protein n=1 Tax=Bacteroides caecigallinarum TaxID=1411144 RepID=UPI001F379CE3|nr:hypothetical protein [Bacteroides caecigallinarum]MCF2583262.1 hypothetical protein [Bacteroides caecigallinarum]